MFSFSFVTSFSEKYNFIIIDLFLIVFNLMLLFRFTLVFLQSWCSCFYVFFIQCIFSKNLFWFIFFTLLIWFIFSLLLIKYVYSYYLYLLLCTFWWPIDPLARRPFLLFYFSPFLVFPLFMFVLFPLLFHSPMFVLLFSLCPCFLLSMFCFPFFVYHPLFCHSCTLAFSHFPWLWPWHLWRLWFLWFLWPFGPWPFSWIALFRIRTLSRCQAEQTKVLALQQARIALLFFGSEPWASARRR